MNLAMPGPRLLHVANPSCRGALQKVDEDSSCQSQSQRRQELFVELTNCLHLCLQGPSMFEVLLAALVCLPGATLRPKAVLQKLSKIALDVCAVTEFTSVVLYIYHSESQMDPEVCKKPLVYKRISRRMSEMMDTQQRLMTKCSSFQKVQVCSMLNCL